ncbi:hypothetical protein LZC95_21355 [Pendulispora brunnea]|uniref:Uncharacterized protein n=1 Tax=Pendulispora brunnea TaxID=2905690 RepID=A0ABZ2KLE2_9BACT
MKIGSRAGSPHSLRSATVAFPVDGRSCQGFGKHSSELGEHGRRQRFRTRFAFTDVYFSGTAYIKFQKDVLTPLAELHPECEFQGFWMREEVGFEVSARLEGYPTLRLPRKTTSSNVNNKFFTVTFAIGDDPERILEATVGEPIYVFDENGIIQTCR